MSGIEGPTEARYSYPSTGDLAYHRPVPVQITRETPSSIEIGQNSKGEPTYSVKCYCEAGLELFTAIHAIKVVEQLRDDLGLPPLLPSQERNAEEPSS